MRETVRVVLITFLSASLLVPAQAAGRLKKSFADMSIEELMNESITSVSKKETKLGDSPAAIALVTEDDIRRLGPTNLAETLRYVPGLNFARINANQWAISPRGFNFQYANKLLVLMDGRSLYTPEFGGVLWDTADTMLEDVERIEIIRGPGATLWGANAVNGVINITTKSARDTQGTLLATTASAEDGYSVVARQGGQLGDKFFYRGYTKYHERFAGRDPAGKDTDADGHSFQTGFRLDGTTTPENSFTLQGDYYVGRTRENLRETRLIPPFTEDKLILNDNHGANVLGRWTHDFSPTSQLSVQSYFDRRVQTIGGSAWAHSTADFELQHRFGWGTRQEITWGGGYRYYTDTNADTPFIVWTPSERSVRLATTFVQDEIAVVPDRLTLFVGSKFERVDSNDIKTQPGARLLWKASDKQTVWAAVSRAFRTPSRFDTDARLNTAAFQPSPVDPIMQVALIGNPHVRAEEIRAHEIGYRVEPSERWSLDIATFYNVYRSLISYEEGEPQFEAQPEPPHLLLPLFTANGDAGHTYGAEVAVQWHATANWRLAADYSWLVSRVRPDSSTEGDSPRHQANLRSYLELTPKWELNTAVSYTGALLNSDSGQHIPAYVRVDVGLVWRPTQAIEAGISVQNLFDPQHQEFGDVNSPIRTEIPRSFIGRLTWRY